MDEVIKNLLTKDEWNVLLAIENELPNSIQDLSIELKEDAELMVRIEDE